VFCGKKPEVKNKEHIIPKWLIKMTGKPNREINLGIDLDYFQEKRILKYKTFSFKSFQFPACEKCNSEFSSLEAKVKMYFERLFDDDYFINSEIDILLDWFDKVRIGLWLGKITLDRYVDLVDPKYFIKKRISHRDRCLFIYEENRTKWQGVQFFGFESPAFKFVPSCFSLRVNNIYFYNYSFDFLFSENIGFPYPKYFRNKLNDTRKHEVEFTKGKEKITTPLISQKFLKPSCYIYQPIIPPEIFGTELELIFKESDYVRSNCLDYKKGKGDIFYFDNTIKKLDDEHEILLTNGIKYEGNNLRRRIARQTHDTIGNLLKRKTHEDLEDKEAKQNIEEQRLLILKAHNSYGKLIKKYRG